MIRALEGLDRELVERNHAGVNLLVGGGGAFALAYHIPIQTADIDGVLFQSRIEMSELDSLVKHVGRALNISLNPYFGTFLHSLPSDYRARLKVVFQGKALTVYALGLTDLLIMKCFAGREKDLPHAKVLIRKGADVGFAQTHIEKLIVKKIPSASKALEFLLEAEEQVGG
jgi:hypothetical protein